MKKLSKILILLVFVASYVSVGAQVKVKIGHINSAELIEIMPGKDSAQVNLQQYAQNLEKELKVMQGEFETKYNDYLANETTLSPIIKANKQKELQDLQGRIEEFQGSAQQELATKRSELFNPIIEEAKKAIEDVAKENGYTYILDSSEGVGAILYSQNGEDIMPLVKKKLGISK